MFFNVQTKVGQGGRGIRRDASESNRFPSFQDVLAFACKNKHFTLNFHTSEHQLAPNDLCDGLRTRPNCYSVHVFVCGTRSEGVLEVQWLLRVQFLIVLKDELAARVTLRAIVCPDR